MKIDIVKIKSFAVPLALFVGAAVLYFVGGKILIGQIRATQTRITTLEKQVAVLDQKVRILSDFAATSPTYTSAVSSALPDTNSSLTFISQVRRGTQNSTLLVSNIKAGSPASEEGLTKAQVGFDVDGTLAEVMNFLELIPNISPISRIEKVRLNQTATAARASVTVSVFWAPFPEKLPDITQPLGELSSEEQAMLADLAKRTQPVFLRFTPSVTTPRADPFSL